MLRLTLLALVLGLTASAQTLNVDFSALAAKAKSKTEVNLDKAMLDQAKSATKDFAKLENLNGLSVHAYEYANAGDYPKAAVEAIVKQVETNAGWKRLLSAHDGEEQVDIFFKTVDGKMAGFVLVAAEAKEVAVIIADGAVELASVQELVNSSIKYDLAALAPPAK